MITRDKAISILRARLECMRRQDKFEECCMVKDCDNCQTNYEAGNYGEWKETLHFALSELERKTGKWIPHEVKLPDRTILNYTCSACGRKLIGYGTETLNEVPYCHCGAKMEEGEQ